MRNLEDALELTLNDPIFEEERKLSQKLYRIGDIIFNTRHKIKDVSRMKASESFKQSKMDQYEERLSNAQTNEANIEKMLQDVQERANPLNTKVSFFESRIRRLKNLIMQQKEEARLQARAERGKKGELRKSQSNFDLQVKSQAEPAPSLNPYVVAFI